MRINLIKINRKINKELEEFLRGYYKNSQITPYLNNAVLDFIKNCRYVSDDIRPLLTKLGYEVVSGRYNTKYILPAMSAIHLLLLGFIPLDDIIDGVERQKNFTIVNLPTELSCAYSLSTKLREDGRIILQMNYGILPYFGKINKKISQCLQRLDGSHTLEINYHSKRPFWKYSPNEYFELIDEATSIFIAESFVIGGLIAGINDKTEENMWKFGIDLGRLCQIRDDYLDYINPQITGKLPFSDLCSRRKRFPVLAVFWFGNKVQQRTLTKILEKDTITNTDICQVIEIILDKKIKRQALNIIRGIQTRTLRELESLPKICPPFEILKEIVNLFACI